MASSEDPRLTKVRDDPSRRPRAVLLTGSGLEHEYVAGRLVEAVGGHLAGVIIERRQDTGGRIRSIGSLRRRYSAATICERVVTKFVRVLLRSRQRRHTALSEVLGDSCWALTGGMPLVADRGAVGATESRLSEFHPLRATFEGMDRLSFDFSSMKRRAWIVDVPLHGPGARYGC